MPPASAALHSGNELQEILDAIKAYSGLRGHSATTPVCLKSRSEVQFAVQESDVPGPRALLARCGALSDDVNVNVEINDVRKYRVSSFLWARLALLAASVACASATLLVRRRMSALTLASL